MYKIGIVGYGNLGKGVHIALNQANDMQCVGIFTRRDPKSLSVPFETPVYSVNDLCKFKKDIDVLVVCGGSATDLPQTVPEILKDFCTVDSFDTHAKIPEYFNKLNNIAKEHGTLGLISVGWDPGIFSLARLYFSSVLPQGKDYTFWGKGVSQGHSDAIRRIAGVKKAVQYTIPKQEALDRIRAGETPDLTAREKHLRECFVVAENGADEKEIERQIKEMPNYFADYDTIVHFISEEEFVKNHTALPHGGFVMRRGDTSDGVSHSLELSLKLDSNPQFTGSTVVAFARAVAKLKKEGKTGAITAFDIPPKYLSALTEEQLRGSLL